MASGLSDSVRNENSARCPFSECLHSSSHHLPVGNFNQASWSVTHFLNVCTVAVITYLLATSAKPLGLSSVSSMSALQQSSLTCWRLQLSLLFGLPFPVRDFSEASWSVTNFLSSHHLPDGDFSYASGSDTLFLKLCKAALSFLTRWTLQPSLLLGHPSSEGLYSSSPVRLYLVQFIT